MQNIEQNPSLTDSQVSMPQLPDHKDELNCESFSKHSLNDIRITSNNSNIADSTTSQLDEPTIPPPVSSLVSTLTTSVKKARVRSKSDKVNKTNSRAKTSNTDLHNKNSNHNSNINKTTNPNANISNNNNNTTDILVNSAVAPTDEIYHTHPPELQQLFNQEAPGYPNHYPSVDHPPLRTGSYGSCYLQRGSIPAPPGHYTTLLLHPGIMPHSAPPCHSYFVPNAHYPPACFQAPTRPDQPMYISDMPYPTSTLPPYLGCSAPYASVDSLAQHDLSTSGRAAFVPCLIQDALDNLQIRQQQQHLHNQYYLQQQSHVYAQETSFGDNETLNDSNFHPVTALGKRDMTSLDLVGDDQSDDIIDPLNSQNKKPKVFKDQFCPNDTLLPYLPSHVNPCPAQFIPLAGHPLYNPSYLPYPYYQNCPPMPTDPPNYDVAINDKQKHSRRALFKSNEHPPFQPSEDSLGVHPLENSPQSRVFECDLNKVDEDFTDIPLEQNNTIKTKLHQKQHHQPQDEQLLPNLDGTSVNESSSTSSSSLRRNRSNVPPPISVPPCINHYTISDPI